MFDNNLMTLNLTQQTKAPLVAIYLLNYSITEKVKSVRIRGYSGPYFPEFTYKTKKFWYLLLHKFWLL